MDPSLRAAEAEAVSARLAAALEAAATAVDRGEAVETAEPLPPDVEAALVAFCADVHAPPEWQQVADRVRAGRTTWHAVWCRPVAEGPGAVGLVRAVLVEAARRLPAVEDRGGGS